MLRKLQLDGRRKIRCAVLAARCAVMAATMIVLPLHVSAQTTEQPSFLGDTFKRVILDPTTYAPAAIAYDATMRDWKTSQPFFTNGYFEHNERFTISGLPNDRPVSYGVGRQRILSDALVTLQMSLANNVADQIFERMLVDRFPTHRKLVRTIGWIERSAFAGYMSYYLSARHYHQAAVNQAYAQQMGLK
jgi:hypothetical protein